MDYKKEIENDLWLADQLEAIRQMECPHNVDVTDAVMQRINNIQPLTKKSNHHYALKVATTAAAACIAGAILIISHINQTPLHAATTIETQDLSIRMLDIYDYCNDYADPDFEENATYTDNPITELI